MAEQLYIRGVVIANGIPDSDNDSLDSKEIRTILTKFEEQQNDVQHDRIHYEGVHIIENWMTDSEITIKGKVVPKNSWCATVKVTNPEIIEAINQGELTCFSLGSVSKDAKTRDSWFIDKRISYHDLKSIEDVIPLFISIVDKGANGYPFEIFDYETYINKNKAKDEPTMSETGNTEARFSLKEWLGLEKHFTERAINKAEEETPAKTNETESQETDAEKNIKALFDKLDAIEEKLDTILNADDIDKEESSEEKEKEKEDEEKVDKENKSSEEEKEEEETDDEKDINKSEEETDETDINKRQTKKTADIPQDINKSANSTFYEKTGRDTLGRKIRK